MVFCKFLPSSLNPHVNSILLTRLRYRSLNARSHLQLGPCDDTYFNLTVLKEPWRYPVWLG